MTAPGTMLFHLHAVPNSLLGECLRERNNGCVRRSNGSKARLWLENGHARHQHNRAVRSFESVPSSNLSSGGLPETSAPGRLPIASPSFRVSQFAARRQQYSVVHQFCRSGPVWFSQEPQPHQGRADQARRPKFGRLAELPNKPSPCSKTVAGRHGRPLAKFHFPAPEL
jgi:hypothetical protein